MTEFIKINNPEAVERSRKMRTIVIAVAALVLVVIAGVVVSSLIPHDYDRITIKNRDALNGVNGDKVNEFRSSLLKLLISKNLISSDAKVDDVLIRDGSVVNRTIYDDKQRKVKTSSFLADIDSIKQTYRVEIIDTDIELTDLSITIACPNASETRYPDSECDADYSTSKSLSNNVPHEMKLESGEKVLVKEIIPTQGGSQIVQIYLYSCNDKNPPKDATSTAVKQWVKDLGDELYEFYTYNVRTGYCEGDTI